jgi:Skp family chaperone for outer membrane proteins
MFWPMFKRAWEASFIPKNIESAWRKTGIWPFQPSVILNTIKRRPCTPTNTKTDRDDLKTPTTTKAVRKFQKAYWDDPSKAKLKKLFRANETLAARTSIAEHRARNLQEALQIEKKKRQRGKRLNLCGKETSGAQWYGVPEVQEARAYTAAQTAKEEQEKLDKENKKIEAEIKRQAKEADKKAKALQRDIARQATQAKKAEAAAAKAAKKKPTKARKNGRKLGIVVLKPKEAALRSLQVKSGVQALVSVVQEEGVQITTKSGRQVQLTLRAKLREM